MNEFTGSTELCSGDQGMPRIFDCFIFFNELDMLELRLNEMSNYVDTFVLAESTRTHQGQPKPLFYDRNKERFRRYSSRIRHIIVDNAPLGPDPWVRERHQRNTLKLGLTDADAKSTVLISDVDEIIRSEAVAEAQRRDAFCYFSQDLFCYYVNWRVKSLRARLWTKAYAAPYAALSKMDDLTLPRHGDELHYPLQYLHSIGANVADSIIDRAGWHFSWTGGLERIVTKLNSFAHIEPAVRRLNDESFLRSAIDRQTHFWNSEPLESLCIGAGFPQHLQEHEEKYRSLGLISPNSGDERPYYEEPLIAVLAEIELLQDTAVQRALERIHESTSWRLTRPVRFVGNVLKRVLAE
jgi:beta-1,4-mannosyl-glycoprotein beta-1,4-N-acetylglucosaminyltransferase